MFAHSNHQTLDSAMVGVFRLADGIVKHLDVIWLTALTRRASMLYGRLTVVAGDPGEVDAIPPPQERALRPGEIPGLRAVYCLVDRTTGRAAALSIWESREAMEAAEARGDDQRVLAIRNSGGGLISVDRMEVANALWAEIATA